MELTTVVPSDIDVIRSKIKERGLKQIHVAEKIGVSEIHLSYILNGKKDMTEEIRLKLLTYLNGVSS